MKRPSSILVVEPSDIHFDVLSHALSQSPLLKLARSSKWSDAVKLARSKKFDLILTEVLGTDDHHRGSDTLIHFTQSVYPTPVVILTSEDSNEQWEPMMKTGVQDVWIKNEKIVLQLPSLIRQKLLPKKIIAPVSKENPLQKLMDNLKGIKTSLKSKGLHFATQKGLMAQFLKAEKEIRDLKARMFS